MSIRIAGGVHRGRRLRSKKAADLRPTTERVREAVFSIIGQGAVEGVRVLDLYAGTGILAIEALSRGAAWADLVELNPRRVAQIRENLLALSLSEQARVHQARVMAALGVLKGAYGLVFADPPYDLDEWDTLLGKLGEGRLTEDHCLVVVEHRHGTVLEEGYKSLTRTTSRRYGDTAVTIYESGVSSG